MIEADKARFAELEQLYLERDEVVCLNKWIEFEGEDSIDSILARNAPFMPEDFDFISIDVDGADYHLWDSMIRYSPRVVVIEHNPSIPNHIEFVQAKSMQIWQGG